MLSRPVLIAFSVLAGLDVILGGAALGEIVAPQIIGIAALIQAGIAVGFSYYVQGRVAPWSTVAAQKQPDGEIIAGPAVPETAQAGDPVAVVNNPR